MIILHRSGAFVSCLLAVLMALGSGVAGAQQTGPAGEDVMQMEMELLQLHQRLEEIQRSALESNPELEQDVRALGEKMVTVMEEEGFSPEQSLERLAAIQMQLQQPGLEPAQREQLIEQARNEQLMLEKAQAFAMEHEEVQVAHAQLQENLIEAMQEQDPATDELIAQFTQKQQKYEEMQQEMQQAQLGQEQQ